MACRKPSRPLTAQEGAQKLTQKLILSGSIHLSEFFTLCSFSFFFWKARTEEEFHSRHTGVAKPAGVLPFSPCWSTLWFICPFGKDKITSCLAEGGREDGRTREAAREAKHKARELLETTRPHRGTGRGAEPGRHHTASLDHRAVGGGRFPVGLPRPQRSLAGSWLCLEPAFPPVKCLWTWVVIQKTWKQDLKEILAVHVHCSII